MFKIIDKIFVTLISCLVFQMSGDCAAVYFPPLRPVTTANSPFQTYDNTSAALPVDTSGFNYSKIGEIEISLFGRTFQGQSIAVRLSRIEKSLFNRTYATSTNLQRLDNIISNYNQINRYPNISTNVLSRLERQVFNQSYPEYNTLRRLERLEQQMLGATQQGDINTRYELLKNAARNYNPNYASPGVASLIPGAAGSKAGRILNVLGGLGTLGNMGGVMTGFSPQIAPYSTYGYGNYSPANPYNSFNYSPGYSNDNGYNSSGIFGGSRGYSNSTGGFGSGASVTVID